MFDPYTLGLTIAGTSGEELVVNCPYHNDSKPSAEYNPEKGLFYCFGCQTSKTAAELADDLGGFLSKISSLPSLESFWDEAVSKGWLNIQLSPLARDSKYLRSRQVTIHQIERHNIRRVPNGIAFELRDLVGNLIGFQVRRIDKKPKYLFHGEKPPVFPMRNLTGTTKLFVVEGIFGMLRAELALVKAVATMGASNVQQVSTILKRLGKNKPLILMDNDEAGFLSAGKYCLLGHDVIINPHKDDPDELEVGAWCNIAENWKDFVTNDVNEVIDASPNPFKLQRNLESFWRKI
jgi:DNA primase